MIELALLAQLLTEHVPAHWTMTCAEWNQNRIEILSDKNLTEKYKLTREVVAEAFPDIAWGLHRGT